MKIRFVLLCCLVLTTGVLPVFAEPLAKTAHNSKTSLRPFKGGERLTYSISWSRVLQAGIATLEVSEEKTQEGKHVYRFHSTGKTVGFVSTLYSVQNTVQSVTDADELYSLSYEFNQTRGKRKKYRRMVFDQPGSTVRLTVDGREETHEVPHRVADPLLALYYVRTRDDLQDGKSLFVDVHDNGKNWAVEVAVLGRETLKTPLGEFKTIKLRTFPKYEGVFQNKGEIFVWITDDDRRIPVLMRSKVTIGSIVATLTELPTGAETK